MSEVKITRAGGFYWLTLLQDDVGGKLGTSLNYVIPSLTLGLARRRAKRILRRVNRKHFSEVIR